MHNVLYGLLAAIRLPRFGSWRPGITSRTQHGWQLNIDQMPKRVFQHECCRYPIRAYAFASSSRTVFVRIRSKPRIAGLRTGADCSPIHCASWTNFPRLDAALAFKPSLAAFHPPSPGWTPAGALSYPGRLPCWKLWLPLPSSRSLRCSCSCCSRCRFGAARRRRVGAGRIPGPSQGTPRHISRRNGCPQLFGARVTVVKGLGSPSRARASAK